MKIVFFGSGAFAIPAFLRVASHVSLVVSQPDRPTGRRLIPQPAPVKAKALELGLPVATPERSRAPEFLEQIAAEEADFLLVASYGQILSEALLKSARRGGINLHGSILPKYRGAAPIQRAIEAGESETGVTLMQMDKGMDTGAVIDISRTPIQPDETYGALQVRLAGIAADLAQRWAERIASGEYPTLPQDESQASLAPKITRDETQLIFEAAAHDEFNRFRAFTPSPGAFLSTRSGRLKLLRAEVADESGTPGKVLALKPHVLIAFRTGALRLIEVQGEGTRPMDSRAWANGVRLRIGDNLLA